MRKVHRTYRTERDLREIGFYLRVVGTVGWALISFAFGGLDGLIH
jgi:hypothetical protein